MKKHYLLLLAFLVIQFQGLANEASHAGKGKLKPEISATVAVIPTFAQIAPLCLNVAAPVLSTTSQNSITGTWSPAAIDTSVPGVFTHTFTPDPGQDAVPVTINITINPNTTLALASSPPTTAQTVCVNTPIVNISYVVGNGGTGATVTGLPAGVTGVFSGGIFTISGVPTIIGIFNYTVATTGGCGSTTLSGTITVVPNATITLTSGGNNQTLCEGAVIGAITYHTENGVTGLNAFGLPPGVTASFSAGNIAIVGMPTQTGLFNYTISTVGNCTAATATGTIVVNPAVDLNMECGNFTANSLTFDWSDILGATAYHYSYTIGSGPLVSGTISSSGFTVAGVSAGQSVTFTVASVDGGLQCFNPQSTTCLLQPLSSQQFEKESFAFYPNPVRDLLNLKHQSNFRNVVIFDMVGKKVMERKANEQTLQIDVSMLHKGFYIVNATTAEGIHTFKIIKD